MASATRCGGRFGGGDGVVDGLELVGARIATGEEEGLDALVFQTVEEDGVGWEAVASGASSFLVVGFEGVGELEVVDEADVGLVDAEAEGLGGDHDLVVSAHELGLDALPLAGGHAAVVMADGEAVLGEEVEELVRGADGGGVDDAGSLLRLEHGEDAGELGGVVDGGVDGEEEVGALGAGVDDGGVFRVERLEDVAGDFFSGGSGEGEDGRVAEGATGFPNGKKGGAEVVTPLRDGVGLIDDEERDAAGGEELSLEVGLGEALGRDVDKLGDALIDFGLGVLELGLAEGGVEFLNGDVASAAFCCWSCMRAISGETTTTGFGRKSAGSW